MCFVCPERDRMKVLRYMAFSERDLFEDKFDAVTALLYGDMLEPDEEMSSETDSVVEKITSAKILININVIFVPKFSSLIQDGLGIKNLRIDRKINLNLIWSFFSWRGLKSRVLLCAAGLTSSLV